MKKVLFIPILLLVFFSCSPDEETQVPTNTVQTKTSEPEPDTIQTDTDGDGVVEYFRYDDDGSFNDQFGWGVAIDGNWAACGTLGVSGKPGKVFVYSFSNDTWSQTQVINSPNSGYADAFGHRVSISGNYMVVGAYGTRSVGAVYAYEFDASLGKWTFTGELVIPIDIDEYTDSDGNTINPKFGVDVSINSSRDVAVGAYYYGTTAHPKQGAVVMYNIASSGMNSIRTIYSPDSHTRQSNFGISVAIDDNGTLVVGAYTETDPIINMGNVFVYSNAGETLIGSLSPTDANPSYTYVGTKNSDGFGHGVAVDGNYIAVGAVWENYQQGAVYIYQKTSQAGTHSVSFVQKLVPDSANNSFFGRRVGISGDILTSAAWKHNDGEVYVYVNSGESHGFVKQHVLEQATRSGQGDALGHGIDIDGHNIIAGAYYHTIGQNDKQGSISIFRLP